MGAATRRHRDATRSVGWSRLRRDHPRHGAGRSAVQQPGGDGRRGQTVRARRHRRLNRVGTVSRTVRVRRAGRPRRDGLLDRKGRERPRARRRNRQRAVAVHDRRQFPRVASGHRRVPRGRQRRWPTVRDRSAVRRRNRDGGRRRPDPHRSRRRRRRRLLWERGEHGVRPGDRLRRDPLGVRRRRARPDTGGRRRSSARRHPLADLHSGPESGRRLDRRR